MKKFTDQEISAALQTVSKGIQEAIAEPSELASVIRALKSKHNLHSDSLGILAELTRNTLLGLVGPEEFLKELVAINISDKDAREIMSELSQEIFIPLRKAEEQGSKVANIPQSPRQVASEVRPSPILPKVEPQAQQMPGRSQTSFKQNSAPLPPKIVMPVRPAQTLGDVVRSVLPTPPRASSVPPNLPGMLPGNEPPATLEFHKVEPPMSQRPVAPRPLSPAPSAPKIVPPPITSYSADPYREPVDEPLNER